MPSANPSTVKNVFVSTFAELQKALLHLSPNPKGEEPLDESTEESDGPTTSTVITIVTPGSMICPTSICLRGNVTLQGLPTDRQGSSGRRGTNSDNSVSSTILSFVDPDDAGICVRTGSSCETMGGRNGNNITIQNLNVVCHPTCRAIYHVEEVNEVVVEQDARVLTGDDGVAVTTSADADNTVASSSNSNNNSSSIHLLNLTVRGQVQLLVAGGSVLKSSRHLSITATNVDIVSCDCHLRTIGYQNIIDDGDGNVDATPPVLVVQGALTVACVKARKSPKETTKADNNDGDDRADGRDGDIWYAGMDHSVLVKITNVSIGRVGAPVWGSGVLLMLNGTQRSATMTQQSSLPPSSIQNDDDDESMTVSIKDVYSDGMIQPSQQQTVTRKLDETKFATTPLLMVGGILVVGGGCTKNEDQQKLPHGSVHIVGSVATYGYSDMGIGMFGPQTYLKSCTVDGSICTYGPGGTGIYVGGGPTIASLVVTQPVETFGVGARGVQVCRTNTRLDDVTFAAIVTHGDGAMGIELSHGASIGTLIVDDVTTYGTVGFLPMPDGSRRPCSADAVNLQSGSKIDKEFRVQGSLESLGDNVATLAVEGGTIASLKVVRGRIHANGRNAPAVLMTKGGTIGDGPSTLSAIYISCRDGQPIVP